jgi:two-component system nitrate/nitrite response regulator NarL
MRIVLCDDHSLLLDALRPSLVAHGHDVVAAVVSPDDAVDEVKRSQPDLVILDVMFPGDGGLRVVSAILEASPDTKVIFLSAVTQPELVAEALESGAVGFARKDRGLEGILRTIERVTDGEVVIDPDLLRAVASHRRNGEGTGVRWLTRFLTPREREVLARIVAGETTDQMAKAMGVARSTARTHVQSVLQKLGVHSRLQAATIVYGQPDLDLGGTNLPPQSHGLHQTT